MPQLAEHPRKRWTRQECDSLREKGDLIGRYELIEGDIIDKMGQNPPHATVIGLLLNWLCPVFGAPYVRCQLSIRVASPDDRHNEPEPDYIVTREPTPHYSDAHPGPDDILLLVEVSDTTKRFDRVTKASLYARSGIIEYWVVDISSLRLIVYRNPDQGIYQSIVAYSSHESVSPLASPEASVVAKQRPHAPLQYKAVFILVVVPVQWSRQCPRP